MTAIARWWDGSQWRPLSETGATGASGGTGATGSVGATGPAITPLRIVVNRAQAYTAVAAVATYGSVTLAPGTYKIEGNIYWLIASGTAGFRLSTPFSGSYNAASQMNYTYSILNVNATEALGNGFNGTDIIVPSTAASSGLIRLHGRLVVTGSGSLSLRMAQNLSSGAATTVLPGSHLVAVKVA